MVPHQHTDQVLVPAPGDTRRAADRPSAAGVATAPRPRTPLDREALSTLAWGGSLIAGEVLCPGWPLTSPSGEFAALMRRDGNLVIQRGHDLVPVWQAGTGGNSGAFLEMLDDGDLCVFTLSGAKAWSTGTKGNSGAFAQLEDDGVLVVYSFYRVRVWSTEST